jgi:site-specific DNA recombinase
MTPILRCATYARYSSSQQRDASIVDQQRNMMRYAETKGWRILTDFMFSDEAISGAGLDRPGFQQLLRAAKASPRVVDVILVDDTSRISRSLADTVRLREDLNFTGIRFVAVSQGIDSDDEQADVMMTVHGLVDSLYIKELAKKTHRGLEGLALKGFHTGGSCFGYRSEKLDGGSQLQIDEEEAAVVRRIFQMSASGLSLKVIAKELNADGIPPPRGTKKKIQSSWVYTAIREMLRRDIYRGSVVWNKRKYKKRPGTNKRISVPRPESQWVVIERPELRIVPQELWDRVQANLKVTADRFPGMKPGLQNRSTSVPYLFSGILKCGECGANLSILTSRGKNNSAAAYGCPHHANRGVCSNNLYQRRDALETQLLEGLRDRLLDNSAIEEILSQVSQSINATRLNQPEKVRGLEKAQTEVESEMNNLADAIGKSGGSAFLLKTLQAKEADRDSIVASLARYSTHAPSSVDPDWLRIRIRSELEDLGSLLNMDPPRAKAELRRHVTEIPMTPSQYEGKKFYVAEGKWDLVGNDSTGPQLHSGKDGQYFPMVAGVGFEPTTFGL